MPAAPPSIAFRPLLVTDLDLLTGWLRTPHVARWWPKPDSAEALADKYMPRLLGEEDVALYAILVAGRPIGLIQASPAEVRHGAGPDAWGIDLLIGDADLIGRGLGSRIIDRFAVTELFVRRGAALCLADPHQDNPRSIRAFEKAGFRHRGCFEDEGQAYVLLERRSAARAVARPGEAALDPNRLSLMQEITGDAARVRQIGGKVQQSYGEAADALRSATTD